MENKDPIDNDHQTVLIVANWLDENPEFAEKFDYLVEWEYTDDESNNNFVAKFRLKPQFRAGQNLVETAPIEFKVEAPPRGSSLRTSSGQWRSQHAQQRERDISGNTR